MCVSLLYHSQLAAEKLINYLKFKLKLFGPEITFRPGWRIHLSDLAEDELKTLDSLGMFCLPNDKNNRGVLFLRRQNFSISSDQSRSNNVVRETNCLF